MAKRTFATKQQTPEVVSKRVAVPRKEKVKVAETARSILMKLRDFPVGPDKDENLSEEEIDNLLALTYTDGKPILSDALSLGKMEKERITKGYENREIIYEVYGMIRTYGYLATYHYITSITPANPNELIFRSPNMAEGRENVGKQLELLRFKEEGVRGLGKCGRCFSENVIATTKQIRGWDEPLTSIFYCVSCTAQWKI